MSEHQRFPDGYTPSGNYGSALNPGGGGGGNYDGIDDRDLPRWDFKAPDCKVLECIILEVKEIPSKRVPGTTFSIVIVQNRKDGQTYKFQTNRVLQDRIKLCKVNHAYAVVYLGNPPGKNWDNYAVYPDNSYVPEAHTPVQTISQVQQAQQPVYNPAQQQQPVYTPQQATQAQNQVDDGYEDAPF